MNPYREKNSKLYEQKFTEVLHSCSNHGLQQYGSYIGSIISACQLLHITTLICITNFLKYLEYLQIFIFIYVIYFFHPYILLIHYGT